MNNNSEIMHPLCFILMPFGRKSDPSGLMIDFDVIYKELIQPSVEAAGLDPIRADEEAAGGIIHKPMFERLILCEYAVADLTTANANVYYELGIRHAVRPRSTVQIFVEGTRLPFDLGPMRGMPYQVDASGLPSNIQANQEHLIMLLNEAREPNTDSPIFQLIDGIVPPDIGRLKTDVFRDRVEYSMSIKDKLAIAREEGVSAIEAIKSELGPIEDVESGVVIDLLLSYRAVKAWDKMISLVNEMSEPLVRTVLVREQYAFALNRAGRGKQAEKVLQELLKERGPSSETFGILGRVYKDRWEEALSTGKDIQAQGLLEKAIDAYEKGFQSDWRDAYPGINAITLMEIKNPPDPRRKELLPIVFYSVKRRVESGEPDYWDYATLLELAVLGENHEQANSNLAKALASVREIWEPETTLRNLRLIRESRAVRGEDITWMIEIENRFQEMLDTM